MNQELIEQLMEECTEYWTDKGDIYFDKEKFADLVTAQEPEPLCWQGEDKCPNRQVCFHAESCLYTTPLQRKPLTDEIQDNLNK